MVFGHSEGGLIALLIGHDLAGKEVAPAGLVLAGTAGRPTGDVIRGQVAANLRRTGLEEAAAKPYNDYVDLAIKQLLKDGPTRRRDLPACFRPPLPSCYGRISRRIPPSSPPPAKDRS